MQHSRDYCVEDTQLTALATNNHGYYREINVINHTTSRITITDRFDNQTNITPEGPPGSYGHVTIYIRYYTGPRESKSGNQVEIPAKKITIPHDTIMNTTCYVEELDSVISKEELSDFAEHPSREGTFDEKTNELFQRLTEQDSLLSIKAIANDPEGVYDEIYMQFMGQVIELPVLHQPDENRYVKFYVKKPTTDEHKGRTYAVRYHMSELENESGYIELGTGEVVHLTTRYDKLEKGLHNMRKKAKASTEEIENIKSEKDKECQAEIQRVKTEHQTEKTQLENKIQVKEQEVNELKEKLQQQQNLVSHYESQQQYEKSIQQSERQRIQNEAEREKKEKAKHTATSEVLKTITQVFTTVISLITLFFTFRKKTT